MEALGPGKKCQRNRSGEELRRQPSVGRVSTDTRAHWGPRLQVRPRRAGEGKRTEAQPPPRRSWTAELHRPTDRAWVGGCFRRRSAWVHAEHPQPRHSEQALCEGGFNWQLPPSFSVVRCLRRSFLPAFTATAQFAHGRLITPSKCDANRVFLG